MAKQSPVAWLRLFWLFFGRPTIAALWLNLFPLILLVIGAAGTNQPRSWTVLGIFHFPDSAKPAARDAFGAVNLLFAFYYLFYLGKLAIASRRSRLTLMQVASLPIKEQRMLLRGQGK